MAKSSTAAPRLDHFFSAVAARLDLWRDLARAAQAWASSPTSRGDASLQAAANEALTALLPAGRFPGLPGRQGHERDQAARVVRRRDGHGAAGAARLVGADVAELSQRCRRVRGGRRRGVDRARDADRRRAAARPYFEVLFVTPTPPSRWAAHAQQIRKLRRPQDEFVYEPVFVGSFEDAALAVILNTNLESVVIYDGFSVRIVARRAAAQGTAVVAAVARAEARAPPRRRPDAGESHQALPARARHHPARRPEAGGDDFGSGGRRHPARVLRSRRAARDPPLDPLGRGRAQRDAVLRQPEEVRAEAGRHLPRPAGGARQVDLQVGLDPRHGRVLRRQPVPRGIVGDLRRTRQHARADRQHQEGAGAHGARLRRRSGVLRHQRHLDVEQDGPPGAARARRHRHRRSQLPQVAPLRHGARRRAAVLRRSLPDGGVFDVRRGADPQHQEGPARSQGRRPARQGQDRHAHQLHLRRPRLRRPPGDGRVPGDQAEPDLPVGRGVVRLRPLLAALPPAHGDGRARGSQGSVRRSGVPGALSRAGEAARRRSRSRRTRACSTRG